MWKKGLESTIKFIIFVQNFKRFETFKISICIYSSKLIQNFKSKYIYFLAIICNIVKDLSIMHGKVCDIFISPLFKLPVWMMFLPRMYANFIFFRQLSAEPYVMYYFRDFFISSFFDYRQVVFFINFFGKRKYI